MEELGFTPRLSGPRIHALDHYTEPEAPFPGFKFWCSSSTTCWLCAKLQQAPLRMSGPFICNMRIIAPTSQGCGVGQVGGLCTALRAARGAQTVQRQWWSLPI